jgi:hypothetical protein
MEGMYSSALRSGASALRVRVRLPVSRAHHDARRPALFALRFIPSLVSPWWCTVGYTHWQCLISLAFTGIFLGLAMLAGAKVRHVK